MQRVLEAMSIFCRRMLPLQLVVLNARYGSMSGKFAGAIDLTRQCILW